MRRFRLLGFYVAGVVAIVGLAIGAVSMRRTMAEAETPRAREDQSPSRRGQQPMGLRFNWSKRPLREGARDDRPTGQRFFLRARSGKGSQLVNRY